MDSILLTHAPIIGIPMPQVNRHADSLLVHPSRMSGMGKRIKQARQLRELSQTELGTATGLKQSSISEIESGETKMIEADTLIAICGVLKVRPEWVVSNKGEMTAIEPLQAQGPLRDVIAAYNLANDDIKDVFTTLAQRELNKSAKTLRK